MNRRNFIKNTAIISGTISIIPSSVFCKGHIPPSDRLYIAMMGVGGRGSSVIKNLELLDNVRFVALCDVDDRQSKATFERHKKTKKYKDYRRVYDKHLKSIDAVVVCTPDHMHAPIALPFMKAKKHAYVEKPLTHNIKEARLMAQIAKQNNLITQMGDQGSSAEGMRRTQELIEANAIGKVYKVDCWTNRPVWPQGMQQERLKAQPIPKELDWDLWLGVAQHRPYNEGYLPFKWRGFWDFGTGSLGDMACHIMATPFKALELGYPYQAEASCTTSWVGDFRESTFDEGYPASSIVRLNFKSKTHGDVNLNWYDGGIMPEYPKELKEGDKIGDQGGGCIFYGDQGILISNTYSANPRIVVSTNSNYKEPEKTLPRVEGGMSGHQKNWVNGCINGTSTSSPFAEYAGPLTESVLMGNLAIRAFQQKELKPNKKVTDWEPFTYPGRKKILWDGESMKVKNYKPANEWVSGNYRKDWGLDL